MIISGSYPKYGAHYVILIVYMSLLIEAEWRIYASAN